MSGGVENNKSTRHGDREEKQLSKQKDKIEGLRSLHTLKKNGNPSRK